MKKERQVVMYTQRRHEPNNSNHQFPGDTQKVYLDACRYEEAGWGTKLNEKHTSPTQLAGVAQRLREGLVLMPDFVMKENGKDVDYVDYTVVDESEFRYGRKEEAKRKGRRYYKS